jgi:hypothetical protein
MRDRVVVSDAGCSDDVRPADVDAMFMDDSRGEEGRIGCALFGVCL